MHINDQINRVLRLIKLGRFQKHVVKSDERFTKVESNVRLKLEGLEYAPYIDAQEDIVVFATFIHSGSKEGFEYLSVTRHEYMFGSDDDFVWANRDDFGFDYLE